MDDGRFDALSRALGAGATRRGALGILAGVAGLGLSEVGGKRRQRRTGETGERAGRQHGPRECGSNRRRTRWERHPSSV